MKWHIINAVIDWEYTPYIAWYASVVALIAVLFLLGWLAAGESDTGRRLRSK